MKIFRRPVWPSCKCVAGVHECWYSKDGRVGPALCLHCDECNAGILRSESVDSALADSRIPRGKAKHLAMRRVDAAEIRHWRIDPNMPLITIIQVNRS